MYYFHFLLISSIIFLSPGNGNSTENERKLIADSQYTQIDPYDFPDQHIKS